MFIVITTINIGARLSAYQSMIRKDKSTARIFLVKAPLDIKSTPVELSSAIRLAVMLPETSSLQRPPLSVMRFRMSES